MFMLSSVNHGAITNGNHLLNFFELFFIFVNFQPIKSSEKQKFNFIFLGIHLHRPSLHWSQMHFHQPAHLLLVTWQTFWSDWKILTLWPKPTLTLEWSTIRLVTFLGTKTQTATTGTWNAFSLTLAQTPERTTWPLTIWSQHNKDPLFVPIWSPPMKHWVHCGIHRIHPTPSSRVPVRDCLYQAHTG